MSLDLTEKNTNRKTNEIDFETYLNMCIRDPHITMTATQRIYQMILSHGTTELKNGSIRYNFFQGKIFGSQKQIDRIMSYYKAASLGLDIKKRVLLLLGPPGGGKSLLLEHIKKGLAEYTHTYKGSLYKISGCPINEDPLHLIEDEEDRKSFWRKHKIKIEGKLCPVCKHTLENEWMGNVKNAKIERFFIDEETRSGIGTFAPSEKNDMSELYGSLNQRKVVEYGNESDPRAYDFNGELHKANRGIMEFIEVLKADPSFLHILLTLAEEQQFKTPRFPLQYVDESLIGHTNEGEFKRFISIKENEAVIDRLFIVHMPYNIIPHNEELIYHSALKNKLVVEGVTLHPGAIRLASSFACATRIAPMDPNTKKRDVLRDGMQGLSPRFILNAMAIAMVETKTDTVTVSDFYHTLKALITDYPVLSTDKRREYLALLEGIFIKHKEANERLTLDDINLTELDKKGNSLF